MNNSPLSIHDLSLFSLVEDGVYTGKAKSESSKNLVEKLVSVSTHLVSPQNPSDVPHFLVLL